MAIKKYLSLDRLTEYDALIKQDIADGDATSLSSANTYTNGEITKLTNGTTVVAKATNAVSADSAAKLSTARTISLAGDASGSVSFDGSKDVSITVTIADDSHNHVISNVDGLQDALNGKAAASHSHNDLYYTETEIDTKLAAKADSTHKHDNDYDTKGAAATALTSAQTYADNAASRVKNDLLNGAGAAYDTLKELGELIDGNKGAIDALEEIASGKANAEHTHEIADVNGLQGALDGKAAASHGTHVTYSTTAPVMDGTASAGTASTVARSDHKHPTDTSRASKTEFDTHTSNTTVHITAAERTNWGTAYTHSQAAHAPSNAEKNQNAFSNVKVGSTTIAADSVTDTLEIAAGTGISVTGDATNDKVTITNSGVIAVSTGSANGTISVNTNGTAANVAVKGLGSAAYTSADAYAPAGHTHTVDSTLSATSTNPVQNKVINTALTGLTDAVSAHTEAITTMQGVINNIQEITSAEIQALFA